MVSRRVWISLWMGYLLKHTQKNLHKQQVCAPISSICLCVQFAQVYDYTAGLSNRYIRSIIVVCNNSVSVSEKFVFMSSCHEYYQSNSRNKLDITPGSIRNRSAAPFPGSIDQILLRAKKKACQQSLGTRLYNRSELSSNNLAGKFKELKKGQKIRKYPYCSISVAAIRTSRHHATDSLTNTFGSHTDLLNCSPIQGSYQTMLTST